MPVGTPNSRDVVFIQRGGPGNNFYEEVHISGSNLIFYTDTNGRVTADKTSSFFTGINCLSASWASQSLSTSFAQTASFALNAAGGTSLITGSTYPITSSWALFAITASFTSTASLLIVTQSNTAISASWASSSLFSFTSVSSSWASSSISASYALTSRNASTASYVTGSEVFVDKLSSPHIRFGHKRINILSSSYVDGLVISLNDTQSVYVKTSIHGPWSGSAPVGYVSEYFLQKGTLTDTETQPGVIIREDNNNKGARRILSQIVDPGPVAGAADIIIQYIVEGNFNFNNAIIAYEIRGEINSIL